MPSAREKRFEEEQYTVQVRVEQVSKMYQTSSQAVTALHDVSLELEAGEFVAICGKSGCGKSTLLMIMGGLLRPDRGRVLVGGQDLYALSESQRARYRAASHGFVFQQFHLVPYLNVWDNILSARLGVSDQQTQADVEIRAERLLERLNLTHRREHVPGQLSTGEKQRTALARALLNRPQVLLADEPTGNLDREHAVQVMGYLTEFAQEGGIVVLVTHDRWAADQAQRVLEMNAGVLTVSMQASHEELR